MPLFRKRRYLKKFKTKSEEMMKETETTLAAHPDLKPEEVTHLKSDLGELARLYSYIFPPSLPWKTKLIRLTIILLIFGSLASSGYFLLKSPPTIKTVSTKIIEGKKEFTFIPLKRAFEYQTSAITRTNYSEPVTLAKGNKWDGWVLIDLFVQDNSLILLSLEPENEESILNIYHLNPNLTLQSKPLRKFRDKNLIDGASIKIENGWLLAFAKKNTAKNFENERILLIQFDNDWEQKGTPLEIPITNQREEIIGMALGRIKNQISLLTLDLPPPTASAIEKSQPILRTFSINPLVLLEEKTLPPSPEISFHPGGVLLDNGSDGFEIILSGYNPLKIAKGDAVWGDELFLLRYSIDYSLREVIQITNNGLPHDFSPRDHILINKWHFISFLHLTLLPQKPEQPLGFPPNSGSSFIRALDETWAVRGALITFNAPIQLEEGLPLEGVNQTQIAYFGNSLYSAHLLHQYLPEEEPERSQLIILWQELSINP